MNAKFELNLKMAKFVLTQSIFRFLNAVLDDFAFSEEKKWIVRLHAEGKMSYKQIQSYWFIATKMMILIYLLIGQFTKKHV